MQESGQDERRGEKKWGEWYAEEGEEEEEEERGEALNIGLSMIDRGEFWNPPPPPPPSLSAPQRECGGLSCLLAFLLGRPAAGGAGST